MLYSLFVLIFCVGIFIHKLVTRFPVMLEQAWAQESAAYLKTTPPNTLLFKMNWRDYFLFSTRPFLILDIVLLITSMTVFYHFNDYFHWASALLFTWLLITSSFIDFEHQILPDELTYCLLWTGLVCSCWNLYTDSINAILGAFVAYLVLWVLSFSFKKIRKKEGIGQGDLKLLAAIAAWTGLAYLPLILLLASLLAITFIISRKIFFKKPVSIAAPFGPFLGLSGWLVLLWGHAITSFLIYQDCKLCHHLLLD